MTGATRPLPKTLQRLLADHPHKLEDGWAERDGFNERNPKGWSYWLLLKPGWINPNTGTHTIHEDNVKECLSVFHYLQPCNCEICYE